jgi:hypothetical protein
LRPRRRSGGHIRSGRHDVPRARENFQIWRLRSQQGKWGAQRAAAVRKAVKEKRPAKEIEDLEHKWDFDFEDNTELIDEILSRQIFRAAKKCDLPLPPREEDSQYWNRGHIYGSWSLTREGRTLARFDIHQAEQAQRERWTWWVPLVFGLIGSLTGLASILLRK